MNSVCLQSDVVINGRDFWGRKSKMRFFPGEKGKGWLWKTCSGNLVPLNYENVKSGIRRIQFSHNKSSLHIFEHIGFLKWMGLMDVIIESNSWPPFFGRGTELLTAITEKCVEDRVVKWHTISQPIRHNRPGADIEVLPWDKKILRLNVVVDYPGIGKGSSSFSFPDKDILEKVSSVYTQGWPPYLFYLSKIASVFGWPNHRKIVWPQKYQTKELLKRFLAHRALDILGGLSLICEDSLLAADITSICCGHRDDLILLPQIAKTQQPLA